MCPGVREQPMKILYLFIGELLAEVCHDVAQLCGRDETVPVL